MTLTQPEALTHPLVIGGLLTAIIGYFISASVYSTGERGSKTFGGVLFCVATWSFTYALRPLFDPFAAQFILLGLQIMSILGAGILWVIAVERYVGNRKRAGKQTQIILIAVSTLFVVLVFTHPIHGQFFSRLEIVEGDGFGILATSSALIGGLYQVYIHSLAIWGAYRLYTSLRKQSTLHRNQSILLLLAVATVLGASFYDLFWPGPGIFPRFAISPIANVFVFVFITVALYGYEFMSLVPIAREKVIDAVPQAVIVLDDDGVILNVNTTVVEMTEMAEDEIVGEEVSLIFPDKATELLGMEDETEEEFTIEINDTVYEMMVEKSPITGGTNQTIGSVLMLTDITNLKQQTYELRRKNERLEQMRSVISHDLRNPLNMVSGYGERIEKAVENDEVPDKKSVEHIQKSAKRMENIVNDVLDLANQGMASMEMEQVDLEDVATDAWSMVQANNCSVNIDTDLVVYGYRSQLQTLFENLFRNAAQHGGDDVTITVEDISDENNRDGFYVYDDGVGLPEDSDIFTYGVTQADAGTGIGLAIVDEVVDSHGWEIRAGESESGGAKFTIVGVRRVSKQEEPEPTPAD